MERFENYCARMQRKNFKDLLFTHLDQCGESNAEIYKRGEIDRRLFSKVICKDYTPSKNVVIKLAVALQLDTAEFNQFLNSAGYSLTDSTSDMIISYCVENHIYKVMDINEKLYDYGCTTLL